MRLVSYVKVSQGERDVGSDEEYARGGRRSGTIGADSRSRIHPTVIRLRSTCS